MINKIPLASGMGSSAAAVVGGLLAANEICYNKLPSEELIQIAAALEGHPDNAVPAFAGGFCVSFDENGRTGYVRLPLARSGMKAAVCVPEIDLPTERARGILPARVPMSDAVHNLSRAALMIAAIAGRAGREVMGIAVGDRLHQAVRMKHIPGAAEAFGAARKAGAYGVCVSGAGPSILALCPPSLARRAAGAMVLSFRRRAIKSRAFILNFTDSGASVESGSRRRVR